MSENFSLLSTEYNSPAEVKRLRAIARLHFLSAVKRRQFIPLASVSKAQADTQICILITDSKLQIRRDSMAVWNRVSLMKNLETVKILFKLIEFKVHFFTHLRFFDLQICIYMSFIYLFGGTYCKIII